MPEFVNRAWGWFQTRPNIQKVVIVLSALVVLLLLSRAVAGIAALICLAALIALVVQWMRSRPVRGWAIVAVGAMAVTLVFGGLASAIYGPTTTEQAKAPRVQKPQPEKQQKPSSASLPTTEEQAATPTPEPPTPTPEPPAPDASAPKPTSAPKPAKKPEQKPQERSLYSQAVQKPLAPYKVDCLVILLNGSMSSLSPRELRTSRGWGGSWSTYRRTLNTTRIW